MYLLEAVSVSLGAEDPHPAVFDALCVALGRVGEGDGSAAVAWFLWALLGEIGSRPVVGRFGAGGETCALDPSAGRLVEDPGARGAGSEWRVRGTTAAALGLLDGGASIDDLWAVARGAAVGGEAWDAGSGDGGKGAGGTDAGGTGEGMSGEWGSGEGGSVGRAARLIGAYLSWVTGREIGSGAMYFARL